MAKKARPSSSSRQASTAARAVRKTSRAGSSSGSSGSGVTPFQERLYALCKCIPAGRVATYGILAAILGSAPRAVGQGMRRNPFAPVVPCHRVIAASLELGGFSGSWGPACESVQKKRRMLAEEGVPFDEQGRLVRQCCLMGETELRAAAAAAGVAGVVGM